MKKTHIKAVRRIAARRDQFNSHDAPSASMAEAAARATTLGPISATGVMFEDTGDGHYVTMKGDHVEIFRGPIPSGDPRWSRAGEYVGCFRMEVQ